jgi:oligo-1,6-glucosidase
MFDHLETPGHTRFDDYCYDPAYLKRFYMKHLNADRGYGWSTLFFNNHDNPRMVSKIDPSGKYASVLAGMLAVLQLTLRGTPFLYQGDETGARNENFSSIDELQDVESLNLYAELVKTMPPDKAFARVLAGTRDHARMPLRWEEIESQRGTADSVWRFYRDLIALRRSSKALIYGALEFLKPKDKTLLLFTRSLPGSAFYIEVNLRPKERRSHAPRDAELLVCNYTDPAKKTFLRPYEARVYKLET